MTDTNITSLKDILTLLHEKKSAYWENMRIQNALVLFHEAARRVPAYKDFLNQNSINPDKIKTWEDFKLIPPINKTNYLRQYPLADLGWDGLLNRPLTYTASSGSSGLPTYFYRDSNLDRQYATILYDFVQQRRILSEPTLVIVCFGMGLWIAGMITYNAFMILAQDENLPFSLVTPGIKKAEILDILENVGDQYQNIVLAGYPPFLKDVIDEATEMGIDFSEKKIMFLFAAEAITEDFRHYLVSKVGEGNQFFDTINIYGSADIGAMAYESALSIVVRKLAEGNKSLLASVFQSVNKTPTLAQYNPLFITFEAVDKEILLTGKNAMPLVRYAIGDSGGVLNYDRLVKIIEDGGGNFLAEIEEKKIGSYITQLPFVYIYERSDMAVTLYGLWLYPEWIRKVMFKESIRNQVTGKFTMATRYDEFQNQYLEINIEMKKNMSEDMLNREIILNEIIASLKENSSEYRELFLSTSNKVTPRLVFWPSEDSRYFAPGNKQKWVDKG